VLERLVGEPPPHLGRTRLPPDVLLASVLHGMAEPAVLLVDVHVHPVGRLREQHDV
jgi:hypothetical protein